MLTRSPYRCPGDDSVIHHACTGMLSHWAGPVDGHVARTSLGDTYLLSIGPATGRPVVVLAGGDLPASGLRALAEQFDAADRVFLVDLPGLPGASAGTRPDTHIHTSYGRWLTDVFDALGIAHAPVVALGWSASVAAAVSDVDRIDKLVLGAPLGIVPRTRWNRALIPGLQWRSEPSLENTDRYLRALAGNGFEPDDLTLRWSCRVGAYCTSMSRMPRIERSLWRRWQNRAVEVVVGEQDPVVQASALRRVTDDIGAQLRVLPGVGHLLALEAPAVLAEDVYARVP